MLKIVIAIVLACAGLIVWQKYREKSANKKKVPSYVCECGEKDCVCVRKE